MSTAAENRARRVAKACRADSEKITVAIGHQQPWSVHTDRTIAQPRCSRRTLRHDGRGRDRILLQRIGPVRPRAVPADFGRRATDRTDGLAAAERGSINARRKLLGLGGRQQRVLPAAQCLLRNSDRVSERQARVSNAVDADRTDLTSKSLNLSGGANHFWGRAIPRN
jgi:hypothetical protein